MQRDEIIDVLRGIAIFDMMIVHYSGWLDDLRMDTLGKSIRYSDFAIEAFILLAGFVVGSYYLAAFRIDARKVARKLCLRALQVVGIQYVMIATLSIPTALIVGPLLTGSDSITQFAIKSFLFLNQVPLLHILPTFIPFFLMSIPLLYALKMKWDLIVVALSIGLFTWGQWHPYLPLTGLDNAIFPPVLWQIYFVGGALLGKHRVAAEAFVRDHGRWNVFLALGGVLAMAAILHGHHVVPDWGVFLQKHELSVNKFPLNWLGLLYHGSILYLVIALTVFFWAELTRHGLVANFLSSLGRNSLMVFIVHVYMCFAVTYWAAHSVAMAVPLILINIVGSFWLARMLDAMGEICSHAPEPKSA